MADVDHEEGGSEVVEYEYNQVEMDGIPENSIPPHTKIYKSFKCHSCKVYFSRLHTLKAHVTYHHPELDWNELYRTTVFYCSESDCQFIGRTRTDLLSHLHLEHDFVLHKVEGEFFNQEDFTLFFERLQKAHKIRFVKKRGKCNESISQYFVCSRDGFTKSAKCASNPVRKRNSKSHKIGTFCTAHVNVRRISDGRITIEGYTTHYNHRVEGKHLCLLDSERQFIKYHAQIGVSIRDIIDLIHRTIGASVDEDDPLRFLNNRTVKNIINSLNTTVPESATKLFAQINGNAATVETRTYGTKREATLVDVVRGHTQSLEESYEIFIDQANQDFGKEEWEIRGSKNIAKYKVERVADKCPHEQFGYSSVCPLICVHCKCCAHIYHCNCNSGKYGKMCQHIHAICQYLRRLEKEQTDKSDDEIDDAEMVCDVDEEEEDPCEEMNAIECPHGTVEIIEEALSIEDSLHHHMEQVKDTDIHEELITEQIVFEEAAIDDSHDQHVIVTHEENHQLVDHDYGRALSPGKAKAEIDPTFCRVLQEAKQLLTNVEKACAAQDVLTASLHFTNFKSLITKCEGPRMTVDPQCE